MNSASDFTLIDLHSQRKAVQQRIQGGSRAQILAWLNQYGVVTEIPERSMPPWKQYWFESFKCPGLGVTFNFDGDPAVSEKHLVVVLKAAD